MCESRDWEYQVTGDLNTTFGHRHHLYSAALPCFYALHHLIPELIFFLHLTRDYGIIISVNDLWAISSAGRASALQAECQQFDPVIAHHNEKFHVLRAVGFFIAISLPPYLSFNLLHPRSRSFARRFAPSNDVRCGTSSILLSPTIMKSSTCSVPWDFLLPFLLRSG